MNSLYPARFNRLLNPYFFIVLSVFTLVSPYLYNVFSTSKENDPGRHAPTFRHTRNLVTISDKAFPGSIAAVVSANRGDGNLTYSILEGNVNNAFAIHPSTGSITIARRLNHHTRDKYNLTVKAVDPQGHSCLTSVMVKVEEDATDPDFDVIAWNTAKSQPFTVSEAQGKAVGGKLYTFGGFDSQKPGFTPTSRAYRYDPAANTWTGIAPMPPTNGTNYGGVTHAGFATDGTDIYFAGGYTSNTAGNGQKFGTKEVWKYIVAEDRYVRIRDLPIVVAAGQLEYLGGKLYHIAGTNAARTQDLGDNYVLDLANQAAGWKPLAPLPNPRQHAGSAVYENKIYFIGGQHGHDSKLAAQKDVHVYDPLANTWTKLADLPVPAGASGRGHISSATVVAGKYIIVMGGETVHSSKRTNMVSAYNPATNTWKNLTPLPQERYSGVAANLAGVLYYTGGSRSSITFKGIPQISTGPQIQAVTLINADTDQAIKALADGDTLNLSSLPSKNLNILATTNPAKIGSVQFNLTGEQNINVIESKAPYAFFGDNGAGDYYAWTPPVGQYTLKLTPFSSAGGAGTAGPVKTINFTVVDNTLQNVTLPPIADAYVRNGSYAGINYGSDTALEVKTITTNGFTRHSYLKFSLANIGSVGAARLRVYGVNTNNANSINISAFGLTDNSWAENSINFNNAPLPSGSALSSVGINNVAKYYEFDVTDFVRSRLTGDKLAGFFIKDTKNSDIRILFNSRENLRNPPQLVISGGAQSRPVAMPVTSNGMEVSFSQPAFGALRTKVYPNPVRTKLNLQFAKGMGGIYDLQITDASGRIYKLGKTQVMAATNRAEIDISKLSLKAGVYFLRIQYNTKQTEVIKLIAE